MLHAADSQKSERPGSGLRKLIAADPGISDLAQRRAAQLVAVVTLVLFVLTGLAGCIGLILEKSAFFARLPVIVAVLLWHGLSFAVNRTRYYRGAAVLLCLGPVWSNAAVGFADPGDPIWYAFMPVAALLASTLLAFPAALSVSALSVASTAAVVAVEQESMGSERAMLTLTFVIFFSAIVLATARFRSWVEQGRRAELLLLERRLAETQRMEALGRLAAGVAHDFNNFLTVIQGNVDLARREPSSKNLDEIESAAERAASLIAQLLSFAREQPRSPVALRLDDVVRNLEPIMARLAGKAVELTLTLGARWPIDADPVQLEQILLNLIANARDAMAQGGQIELKTCDQTLSADAANGPRAGDYVVLSVRDTGTGMDAATLARAFEPFFSTKERGKGSGLGLATVRSIVSESGGAVAVESELALGTTFHVFLPRSSSESALLAATGMVAVHSS